MNFEEYVKLAEYKGLTKSEIKVSVSDEEVMTQVKANVAETATDSEAVSYTHLTLPTKSLV